MLCNHHRILPYTANICSGSTGFHCVTNPTAVSLHFLQTNNAKIECKNCKKNIYSGLSVKNAVGFVTQWKAVVSAVKILAV